MSEMDRTISELLIQAVEDFQNEDGLWNETLDKFITHVAQTGNTLVSWDKASKIFVRKMEMALDKFYELRPYSPGKINNNATNDDFDEMKKRLIQLAEDFDGPPFTIQRLCELLAEPMKNYKKCEKFMRGLEKNLMVVTSWNYPNRRTSQSNDSMVINGIGFGPSNGLPPADRVKPHWSNLPPSPIATGPPKIPGAPDFTAMAAPKSDSKDETEGEKSVSSSEEPKPQVSATIISSSPTITINIKRKIDESSDDDDQPAIPESPTKKLKFDQEDETISAESPVDVEQSAKSSVDVQQSAESSVDVQQSDESAVDVQKSVELSVDVDKSAESPTATKNDDLSENAMNESTANDNQESSVDADNKDDVHMEVN